MTTTKTSSTLRTSERATATAGFVRFFVVLADKIMLCSTHKVVFTFLGCLWCRCRSCTTVGWYRCALRFHFRPPRTRPRGYVLTFVPTSCTYWTFCLWSIVWCICMRDFGCAIRIWHDRTTWKSYSLKWICWHCCRWICCILSLAPTMWCCGAFDYWRYKVFGDFSSCLIEWLRHRMLCEWWKRWRTCCEYILSRQGKDVQSWMKSIQCFSTWKLKKTKKSLNFQLVSCFLHDKMNFQLFSRNFQFFFEKNYNHWKIDDISDNNSRSDKIELWAWFFTE
jgi:hypothetical protein